MSRQKVVVVDLGGNFAGALARLIREKKVYSEIVPVGLPFDELKKRDAHAIIISGGPGPVEDRLISMLDKAVFQLGVPVMAVGQGAGTLTGAVAVRQLSSSSITVRSAGAQAGIAGASDHIAADKCVQDTVNYDSFRVDIGGHTIMIDAFVEYGVRFTGLSAGGLNILAHTAEGQPLLLQSTDSRLLVFPAYFKEEATQRGLLDYFLFDIAGLKPSWTAASFIGEAVEAIQKDISPVEGAVCGMSGGVDSAVSALLVHQAIGDRLTCIFVDHGLLRKGEAVQVLETFRRRFPLNLVFVDAAAEFLEKLNGVSDPEQKRMIIGEHFIRVFEREARKLGAGIKHLVQGTIYPDVVESLSPAGEVIKSHHNVGGLPEKMSLKLVEPVRELFKDEVRLVGLELGLPEEMVWRQPFPGPGLGVRVLGEITLEKLAIAREATAILDEEVRNAGLQKEIWQYFAAVPAIRSVGVSGDQRTYAYTVIIRAVNSRDAMTAKWYLLPHEVLDSLSRRITEEIPMVNRVVYDITSKPPATIEWE